MNEALFGSDLSYEDVIENFFGWENQTIVGTEVLNRVNCLILESKPGKSEPSTYASVRSWIDPRRLVPLRVEKYLPSGQMARRIDTTRVATDDKGRSIPADLTVRGSREDSVTESGWLPDQARCGLHRSRIHSRGSDRSPGSATRISITLYN